MWGKGVRDSFEIVTGRAKRLGSEVKVAKAVCRSEEAGGESVAGLCEVYVRGTQRT